MTQVVVKGYVPGAIGRIAELHGCYYSEHWGFGLFFEAKVATDMSEFLSRLDENRDGFWTICKGNRVEGALAIDGAKAGSEGAHLRWFILSSAVRGSGYGNRLMEKAVDFCKRCGYRQLYLWTFDGLHAARHLYEKFGFRFSEQYEGTQWGTKVMEQKFVLQL